MSIAGGQLRQPIILLGNFRSGTTLVQRVIASHPDVTQFYEPVGMWLFADPAREHGEFDASDATEEVKAYVRSQFLKIQTANNGRRVIEKTPHNILRAGYVREIFPEARYLYIVRNPFSFIGSVELKWRKPAGGKRILTRLLDTPPSQLHRYVGKFINQQWNNRILRKKYLSIWGPRYKGIQDDVKAGDLMTVIARQWARSVDSVEKNLANFDDEQVLRMRYEDFIQDPIEHLGKICAHCDLTMDSEMVEFVNATVETNRPKKWQRLDPEMLARLLPEISQQMDRYGYEVPDELR